MFSSVLQRSSVTSNDLRNFLTGTDFVLSSPAQRRSIHRRRPKVSITSRLQKVFTGTLLTDESPDLIRKPTLRRRHSPRFRHHLCCPPSPGRQIPTSAIQYHRTVHPLRPGPDGSVSDKKRPRHSLLPRQVQLTTPRRVARLPSRFQIALNAGRGDPSWVLKAARRWI